MSARYKTLLNQVKSDASLVRAYVRGDASAFEMIYLKYKDRLFNSIFHQIGCDQTVAEEVTQEVWMAVIRGAASFEDSQDGGAKSSGSFRSWLFSIAHRRCADYWRRQYQNKEVGDTSSIDSAVEGSTDSSEQEQHQHVRELRNMLVDLPEDQRQSFILREEGFSYQEISEITETGVETVKSRLRYARTR